MTATTQISQDQIDRCIRLIDPRTNRAYYQVQSESQEDTRYEVRWNLAHKCLTCTCKGGQAGFSCKHMRWSLAAEAEYKELKRAERAAEQRIVEATRQYQREQIEQAVAEANRKMAEFDNAENGTNEAARRERAAVARDGWKAYERKPFSLLK